MKIVIRDNLSWMILVAFWIVFGITCLANGDYWVAFLSALGLANTIVGARFTAVQRERIRILKATVASLEDSLRDAYRRDRRR